MCIDATKFSNLGRASASAEVHPSARLMILLMSVLLVWAAWYHGLGVLPNGSEPHFAQVSSTTLATRTLASRVAYVTQ